MKYDINNPRPNNDAVDKLVDMMKVSDGQMRLEDYIVKYGGKKFIKLLRRIPKAKKKHLESDATGVYFLMLKERIVYVGQTTNLNKRIETHKSSSKKYDLVCFIENVPKELLKYLEAYYIQKARPKYNKHIPFINGKEIQHEIYATQ